MKPIAEGNIAKPVKVLTESVNGKKRLYIEGVFIECDIVNKNGRLYPLEVMKPVVEKYIQDKVIPNRAYGQLNHPEHLDLDPDRISHRIVELRQEGSNFIGKAIISDSPCGQIVQALINEGGQVAVSTRGGGDCTTKNGIDVINPGFILVTAADIVLDPSAPSAYVNGIMENKEFVLVEGHLKEISTLKNAVNKIIKEDKYIRENRAKKFAKLLENHLKQLTNRKIEI